MPKASRSRDWLRRPVCPTPRSSTPAPPGPGTTSSLPAAASWASLPGRRTCAALAMLPMRQWRRYGSKAPNSAATSPPRPCGDYSAGPLVLASPGFLLVETRLEESTIIDRAIHANVTINSLDVRGLATETPDLSKPRSEEHTSELQSLRHLVCRLL